MKKYIYYLIVIGFFLAAGICYFLFVPGVESQKVSLSSLTEEDSPLESHEITEERTEEEESVKLLVHICGAVKKPGVYEFFEGARIMEGITAAGGFLEDADEGYLNLAQKMTDEQQIYVPTVSEILQQPEEWAQLLEGVPKQADDGRININAASVSDLIKLPGIGEKKANNIIAYRQANGYFKDIADLLKVDGISTSTYEKLKDLIAVAD